MGNRQGDTPACCSGRRRSALRFCDSTSATVPVLLVTSSSPLPQFSCAYKYLSRFSEKGRPEKRALRIVLARFFLVFFLVFSSSSSLVQSLGKRESAQVVFEGDNLMQVILLFLLFINWCFYLLFLPCTGVELSLLYFFSFAFIPYV